MHHRIAYCATLTSDRAYGTMNINLPFAIFTKVFEIGDEKVKKNSTRLLRNSLILVVVICVLIFTFLARLLSSQNTKMINDIGTIYMAGMNERIEMHFQTTIETQFEQLNSIVDKMSKLDASDHESLSTELAYDAKWLDFPYLALYAENGDMEMIVGEQMALSDPGPFHESMLKGDNKVAVGVDASGNDIVLFGVKASMLMSDGTESIAIIGALPCEYIIRVLSLAENDSLVYSHVIRRDGSYVIRSIDTGFDNYFEQLQASVSEKSRISAETYVNEIEAAMRAREHYSTVMERVDSRVHLYCTSLPTSEWYLITIMPYGTMNEEIYQYSRLQTIEIFSVSGIILLMMFVLFVIYMNLSKRQMEELEKAREKALQATKAKSEFLSNMSHDIRTPMNAIVGMTAIAAANIDDKDKIQNCLKKITSSSKHLLGLINDVLDMSKIESGKMTLNMEMISLREVMDSIVSIVQPQIKAKNQNFSIDIGSMITEDVYCDSVRLNQILLNFLSNAIKFTPDSGSIQIALYEEPSPVGDNYVRVHIKVRDNGIGMAEEFKENLFNAFTREDNKRVQKTEGTGLGMAITKYIVDAMKGTIEVNSRQGEGTEFHVTLDLEKALVREEDMVLPDWHMLVVDDDEQLCESAISSLEKIGINAECVFDGETAIELVKKRYEEQNDFQIILLDWKLPGIDGIETARRIRKQSGGDVPLLLISAYDWSEIEQEAKAAGISGFISKPLFRSTLYYGLKQFVETEEPAQEDTAEKNEDEKNIELIGKKILLAEDNELNWEIAQTLLEARGMELDWAENGKICVDKFKQSPVGYYDAIFMDIRMPVMTGYEATKEIRALEREDADLPIIAMTADAFAEDIQKSVDCGMDAHVAKPIDISEIERKLCELLEKREREEK